MLISHIPASSLIKLEYMYKIHWSAESAHLHLSWHRDLSPSITEATIWHFSMNLPSLSHFKSLSSSNTDFTTSHCEVDVTVTFSILSNVQYRLTLTTCSTTGPSGVCEIVTHVLLSLSLSTSPPLPDIDSKQLLAATRTFRNKIIQLLTWQMMMWNDLSNRATVNQNYFWPFKYYKFLPKLEVDIWFILRDGELKYLSSR